MIEKMLDLTPLEALRRLVAVVNVPELDPLKVFVAIEQARRVLEREDAR